MDRQIVYVGAIPRSVDQLQQSKNTMIGLGMALQTVLGTGTIVDGLACAPTSPAGMTVNVGPGSIYSLQNVDNSAFGILPPDTTDQIVKQGIILGTTNFSCPAPATTGQSIIYLVEAAYEDSDTGSTVLPYYNASNPSQAYNGPSNSGTSQNTVRQGICLLQVKAGVAATTGDQAIPAPDAGFTGLWAITVANGATTITTGNISQLATAPFINPKLPALPAYQQSGSATYAQDTSGTGSVITASLTPALTSYVTGQPVRIKSANNCAAGAVMNLNGLGNKAIYDTTGNPVHASQIVANGINTYAYDGTNMVLQSANADIEAVGQCQFQYTSASLCTLGPMKGNKLTFPGGATAIIPSGGITTSPTSCYLNGTSASSLSASTLYYAYLANIGGSYVIDFSATAHATDSTSGIEIKSGDPTRVLIGMVYPASGPVFVSSSSTRYVRSWFNDNGTTLFNNFSTSRSTGDTAPVEVNSEIRCNVLLWVAESAAVNICGTADNSTAGQGGSTAISLDGGTQSNGFSITSSPSAGNYFSATASCNYNSISEGQHYFTLFGACVSSGTMNWTSSTQLNVLTRR